MHASHRLFLRSALGAAVFCLGPAVAWAAGPVEVSGEVSGEAGLTVDRAEGAADIEAAPSGLVHGIINGEAATEADYPAAGGLLIDATLQVPGYGIFPYISFLCSSTLIAPDVVLLAAHCVDELALTGGQGEITAMQFGWSRQADLSGFGPRRADWPEDTVMVRQWVKHEDFNIRRLGIGISDNYDIALLFLETPVLDVRPALLPTPEEGADLAVADRVIAVGWGQQTATSSTQAPPAGTFALKMMGESAIAELGDPEMKIGEERTDVRKCHGDSGGPSFYFLPEAETDDLMRLVGVTSHAYDYTDCFRTGGVDTRVDYHLDWIDAELRAACEDGTRVWCEEPGILPTTYNDLPDDEDAGGDAVSGEEDEGKGGLACATGGGPRSVGLAWIGVLGLLVVRRTRS